MAVLQVLHIPDERLRKVAAPVKEVNAEIQRIVDDMFETMYAEEGIGLAATQVDIHQRIIVIDVSENRDEQLVLINPEMLEKSGETGIEEGCLSIPEQRALVPRAAVETQLAANMAITLFAQAVYAGKEFLQCFTAGMAEGFNMLHRLEENWLNGQNRFDRPGEKLLGAYADDLIVGVCGLNIDPFTKITGTGRLRHLYVDTAWKRNRVGSGLLSEILKDAGLWFDFINTNAPLSAFTFYERAGFVALCDMDKVTHHFCLRKQAR